jgi:hypothetical protein
VNVVETIGSSFSLVKSQREIVWGVKVPFGELDRVTI